jgi:hypothetical protein
MPSTINGRIVGRDANVVLVDFSRQPDPPIPRFPGANGLRERNCEKLRNELFTARRTERALYAASGARRSV